MIANQRNIELVAVGNTTTELKLVLDSDGSTAYVLATHAKAPVRIVRGTPGDVGYWSSDIIRWTENLQLTPQIANTAATEDKWTVSSINTVVDGDNPARELNLRVWPLGLSSVDFEQLKNTGHFIQLAVTKSALLVAMEFAEILDANYAMNRKNKSMGLHCYAVSAGAETGAATGTGAVKLVFLANSKTALLSMAANAADDLVSLVVSGDYVTDGTSTYLVTAVGTVTGANPNDQEISITLSMNANATVTVADATSDGRIVEATAIAATADIVVEAVTNKWVLGQYNWEKTRLNVTTSGMGPATYDAMANEGSGMPEQVAEREWFAKGNEGRPFRTAGGIAPYNPSYLHADLAQAPGYDTYSFRFSHDMLEPLGQPNNSPKSIFIAEDAGATVLHAILTQYVAQA